MQPEAPVDRATPTSLVLILATSLFLKLALLWPAHSTKPFHDALDYVAAALGLLHNGTFESLRAPAYPAFIAAILGFAQLLGIPVPHGAANLPESVTGINGFDLVRAVQVLISTATVWLYYRLIRRFFDQRAAVAAAAIVAFYPGMVAYSHLLWTETLFIFAVVAGLLLADRAARTHEILPAVACGVVLGVSALVRQIGLLVVGVSAVWVWIDIMSRRRQLPLRWSTIAESRGALGRASTLVVAIALTAAFVVLPWTLRNIYRHGELVLISASGGVGLLFGATDDPMGELQRMNDPSLRFDGLKRDRRCAERAREIIAADRRGWIKRCLTHNVPSLFQPVFDGPISHLLAPNKGYGVLSARVVRTLLIVIVGAYAALAFGAIGGAWLAGERRYTLLFVGLFAAYVSAHTTILGVTRHRLPLEVLAAAYAGFFYTRRLSELRAAATTRRIVGALLTLLLFAGVVAMSPVHRIGQFWQRAAVVTGDR